MKHYHFLGLLEATGWSESTYVTVADSGQILAVSNNRPNGEITPIAGYAIPGLVNAHSHAFQYAMAGQAEYLRAPEDDFWSWREAMYHLALSVSPDAIEAIASMVYAEMLRHGYTSVVEFHYLHHDINGEPYSNVAEMSFRIATAAKKTGIGLTLIPIYYRTGDFGKPASLQQRRFLSNNLDAYFRLHEACQKLETLGHGIRVGMGLHSLRAAPPEDVISLFKARRKGIPFHLHIAEQQREVMGSEAYLGARPVAWLNENVNLDEDCHLVHATHLTPTECLSLATSGAVAVICPSTEGNLGDGLFPLNEYLHAGGRLAIGSDSHVCLSPAEELRWLDYGQRLTRFKRNSVCKEPGQDSGVELFKAALYGGRRASGDFDDRFFPIGKPFNALILDAKYPTIAAANIERRLSSYLYAGDVSAHLGTIVAGNWVVQGGRHNSHDQLIDQYLITCRGLRR